MWFAEQINSFLNLGECKEYPMMARSKIPGSKGSRANTSTGQAEQNVSDNAVNSPVKAVTEQIPAEAAPETTLAAGPARVKSEARKIEVVKHESRKNVVPINLEDEIRRRAYELYQQRNAGTGNEAEDWLAAEREVRQRYRQQSA
jgi:hypothetical protein